MIYQLQKLVTKLGAEKLTVREGVKKPIESVIMLNWVIQVCLETHFEYV